MSATKAELEREVVELKAALQVQSSFLNSVTKSEDSLVNPYTMVPIKNYSDTAVSIPFEYKGASKTLILDTRGTKQVGAIPLEAWTELERSSELVSKGYIARTDLPTTNPNVIEDSDTFLKKLVETDIVARFAAITNHHVLHKLLRSVESNKEKSGKFLALESALKARIYELTGVKIVDEEE